MNNETLLQIGDCLRGLIHQSEEAVRSIVEDCCGETAVRVHEIEFDDGKVRFLLIHGGGEIHLEYDI